MSMSKNLLIALGLAAVCTTANAQTATKAKLEVDNTPSSSATKIDLHQATPVMRQLPNSGGARAGVTQTLIGSSYNIYTALVSESTCLTYNPDLKTVMFTHRQNSDLAGGSGIIQTTFSKDGGDTWGNYNLLTDAGYLCRYPSGVIYNPAGNTVPDSAYSVIFGPITSGAGWDGNYFNSMQLSGMHGSERYAINDSTGVMFQHMARIGAVSTTDGKVRVMGDSLDWNDTASPWLEYTAYMNTATFNETTKSFDYEATSISTDFLNAPGDGSFVGISTTYQAWSIDGTIGYVIQIGVPEGATGNDRAMVPIIYKSTDSGATWELQPRMDWTTLTEVTSRILPTTSLSTPRPFFTTSSGFGATVDMNGELHIACEIASQFSDNSDSLLYTAVPTEYVAYFYDVHTDGNGWDALVIDSIFVEDHTSADLGDLTIDSRLQISRNEDASKIFYAWMTSNIDWTTVNEIPDVYAKGYDVATGNETEAVNFTEGTDFEGYNFFIYFSDMCMSDNGTYMLPITVSLPTADELSPMDHYYMTGVEFVEADFVADVSVEDLPKAISNMNIYPNPADAIVNIELEMTENANAEVTIVNMVGQTVYVENFDLVNGLNRTSINVEALNSGVYFVKTTINGENTVSRIVVE